RQHGAFDGGRRSKVTAHCVQRDSHRRLRRLLLDLRQLTPAVSAAMAADAMGQRGFSALRAGNGVDRRQGVMSAALVALGFRRAAFGYGHVSWFPLLSV